MTMNSWNITGRVKAHGVRGKQYPVLWVSMEIATKDGKLHTIFPNFDMPATKAKQAEFIQSKLAKDLNIMIVDASVVPIKMSKKAADGVSWETEERLGVKCSMSGLKFLEGQFQSFNTGMIDGKVIKAAGNKLVLEQNYRIPNKNEFKTRNINVMLDDSICHMFTNPLDKHMVLTGEVSTTDNSLFVYSRQAILL